jgi:hypothetical protein
MKISARLAFFAVLLLTVALPLFADSGPSASGSFEFSSGGHPLSIEFNARTKNNGSTEGQITLSGTANVPDQDVDGEGVGGGDSLVAVSLTVEVDCLNVNGNSAAMSGVITDSNIPALIGNRALLAVADNGEGKNAPALDQFMWGLYGTPDLTWVATDAELEFDPGVGLTWLATDFEREDDIGIPSHPSTTVDCQTFVTGAYSLEDLPHGGGNIQVRP